MLIRKRKPSCSEHWLVSRYIRFYFYLRQPMWNVVERHLLSCVMSNFHRLVSRNCIDYIHRILWPCYVMLPMRLLHHQSHFGSMTLHSPYIIRRKTYHCRMVIDEHHIMLISEWASPYHIYCVVCFLQLLKHVLGILRHPTNFSVVAYDSYPLHAFSLFISLCRSRILTSSAIIFRISGVIFAIVHSAILSRSKDRPSRWITAINLFLVCIAKLILRLPLLTWAQDFCTSLHTSLPNSSMSILPIFSSVSCHFLSLSKLHPLLFLA